MTQRELRYNVRLYGAKGDGKTNDAAAVWKAIAAAAKAGGVVYFPDGVYRLEGVTDGEPANQEGKCRP